METEKIGMREFRENLTGYLEGGRPLAITRHGETLGFFIPVQKRGRKADVEAMRAAAREFDAMIAAWGASEDEFMDDYKGIRRASRERGNPELNPARTRRQHPDSRCILVIHAEEVAFFIPETASAEAEEHLAALVVKGRGDPLKAFVALQSMAALGMLVSPEVTATSNPRP